MSSDFKKFISELVKIILSVIIGFFWSIGSYGWMFIHAFPTGSNKPASLPSQIIEIAGSIIFYPLYLASPMSTLVKNLGATLNISQIFQLTLFLVSSISIYVFLTLIELAIYFVKKPRNTPKI